MISLATKLGASVKAFENTYVEVENVILAMANDLETRNFKSFRDSTLKLLKQNHWDHIYLRNFVSRMKSKLSNLNVIVVEGPKNEEEYQVDFQGLKNQVLMDAKGEYSGVDHDIRCIQDIIQIRKYKRKLTFQDNVALFVTNNNLLVSATNSFLKPDIDKDSVPVVANDIWFTNMCWMMKPDLFPDWPKHMVIANYQSVIHDDDVFWKDFIKRFRSLRDSGDISPEDYSLVRREDYLKQSLKMLTVTQGMSYSKDEVFFMVFKTKTRVLKEKDIKIEGLENKLHKYNKKLEKPIGLLAKGIRHFVEVVVITGLVYLQYLTFLDGKNKMYFSISIIISTLCVYSGASVSGLGSRLEQALYLKLLEKVKNFLNT